MTRRVSLVLLAAVAVLAFTGPALAAGPDAVSTRELLSSPDGWTANPWPCKAR